MASVCRLVYVHEARREHCSMSGQDAQARQIPMVTLSSKSVFPRSSGKTGKVFDYTVLRRNGAEAYGFVILPCERSISDGACAVRQDTSSHAHVMLIAQIQSCWRGPSHRPAVSPLPFHRQRAGVRRVAPTESPRAGPALHAPGCAGHGLPCDSLGIMAAGTAPGAACGGQPHSPPTPRRTADGPALVTNGVSL